MAVKSAVINKLTYNVGPGTVNIIVKGHIETNINGTFLIIKMFNADNGHEITPNSAAITLEGVQIKLTSGGVG